MFKPLSPNQRKFLEYIRDDYKSLGYNVSIPYALDNDVYEPDTMQSVVDDWRILLSGKYSNLRFYDAVYINLYTKKPTKYLK
jgi:hypothetical protein